MHPTAAVPAAVLMTVITARMTLLVVHHTSTTVASVSLPLANEEQLLVSFWSKFLSAC